MHWLGRSYFENNQPEKAIKYLSKAIELNKNNKTIEPYNDYSLYWLGCSYCKNNQFREAINTLSKLIKLAPKEYLNFHWLGCS